MTERILTVGESDSSGAAGIQADIKTIMAFGGYATTALSAVAAEDTKGIRQLQALEPSLVAQQMRMALDDIGADAVKTAFLPNEGIINAVADVLDQYRSVPVVVDPAILARSGERLLDEAAVAALKRRLLVRANVLTPNAREAELLTGMSIRDLDGLRHAAEMMRTLGAATVLLKAGQVVSNKVLYLVATDEGERVYERPALKTRHTLGAGNTLASAVTVGLAQGLGIYPCVERALDYMHQAILRAPDFGGAEGPLNHAFGIQPAAAQFRPGNVKVGNY